MMLSEKELKLVRQSLIYHLDELFTSRVSLLKNGDIHKHLRPTLKPAVDAFEKKIEEISDLLRRIDT